MKVKNTSHCLWRKFKIWFSYASWHSSCDVSFQIACCLEREIEWW